MLVSELLDLYAEKEIPSRAESTQKDYRWMIGHMKVYFAGRDIESIEPKDIGIFLDVLEGKHVRKRMAGLLRAAYRKARGKWFLTKNNPCADVEMIKSVPRTRYITDQEFDTVRGVMPKAHALAMLISLLTYQRQGDVIGLEWKNVREDGIYVEQGKTGKRLLIGYTPELKAVLLECRRMGPFVPRRHVIRRRDGNRYTSQGFKTIWGRVMSGVMKARLLVERFTFHDIRAKAVSDTKDLQKAFEGAGHTNIAMTRRVYDRNTRSVAAHER